MAPPSRKQPTRATIPSASSISAPGIPVASAQQQRRDDALTDFQTRRVHRRLDELERNNPTDIPASSFIPSSSTQTPVFPGLNIPADLALSAGPPKKKQTPNVRKILYAKKSLRDWLEELPSDPPAPYTLAPSPAPSRPARKICASCGALGAYRCARCAEWSCDRTCVETHVRDGGCGVGM